MSDKLAIPQVPDRIRLAIMQSTRLRIIATPRPPNEYGVQCIVLGLVGPDDHGDTVCFSTIPYIFFAN